MFKFLSILLLLSFGIPNCSLFGWTYRESDNAILVQPATRNLDFSIEYPQITTMYLFQDQYWPTPGLKSDQICYGDAKDDLGLWKNVNLKNLILETYDQANQIPVSFAYLPSVEFYSVGVVYDNFSYLSKALPFLTTLAFGQEDLRSGIAELEPAIKNINQLKLLENLQITFRTRQLYGINLSDQEVEILSTMYYLKTLTINIFERWEGYSLPDYQPLLDQSNIQILKDLLPNTKVEVNASFYCDPY